MRPSAMLHRIAENVPRYILLSNILLLLLNGFWVLNEFFFKQEYRRSALNENANNNNGYKQISNDFPPTVASANYLTNINA